MVKAIVVIIENLTLTKSKKATIKLDFFLNIQLILHASATPVSSSRLRITERETYWQIQDYTANRYPKTIMPRNFYFQTITCQGCACHE
jgi:hypothetical protein